MKKKLDNISNVMLSKTLKELEQDGLIYRDVLSETPPKVEYSLSDVGYSLRNVIESMRDWGKDYKKYTKLIEKFNS